MTRRNRRLFLGWFSGSAAEGRSFMTPCVSPKKRSLARRKLISQSPTGKEPKYRQQLAKCWLRILQSHRLSTRRKSSRERVNAEPVSGLESQGGAPRTGTE